jgi:hypothetical protein
MKIELEEKNIEKNIKDIEIRSRLRRRRKKIGWKNFSSVKLLMHHER